MIRTITIFLLDLSTEGIQRFLHNLDVGCHRYCALCKDNSIQPTTVVIYNIAHRDGVYLCRLFHLSDMTFIDMTQLPQENLFAHIAEQYQLGEQFVSDITAYDTELRTCASNQIPNVRRYPWEAPVEQLIDWSSSENKVGFNKYMQRVHLYKLLKAEKKRLSELEQ